MTVQDWHAYAARVDQQVQQTGPAEEPIQDLSTFGLPPATEADAEQPAPAPAPLASVAPVAPVAKPAPAVAAVVPQPVDVTPIAAPVVFSEPDTPTPPADLSLVPDVEMLPVVPSAVAVAAAPIVLAAAEVAPLVLAAAEAAPAMAHRRPTGRPFAVDADLRPVMADRLAGDLADLTRVLLGVSSAGAVPPAALAEPQVPPPAMSPMAPLAPMVPMDLLELDRPTEFPRFAPAADVVPLVPRSLTPEEPPTPVAPTPSLSVDVVLSELSFLDG